MRELRVVISQAFLYNNSTIIEEINAIRDDAWLVNQRDHHIENYFNCNSNSMKRSHCGYSILNHYIAPKFAHAIKVHICRVVFRIL